MRALLFLCSFFLLGFAQPSDATLRQMIGQMLIVGFDGVAVDENSSIVHDMKRYHLGGVILFDKNLAHPNTPKNILSPTQLQKLTSDLQTFSPTPLFIAIDQEGGKVARLKPSYGFIHSAPSAQKIAALPIDEASKLYDLQAQMLQKNGINLNFAPVLDLTTNPDNPVIAKLERAYSADPAVVTKYALAMIESHNRHNILSVVKHFPGHGSSKADSHKGFVDVSGSWSEKELLPYKNLIKTKKIDMVMSAHVFNRQIDSTYPATLSYATNTALLREKLGFRGVIVSDDMQMKAISAHYTLKEALTLAINSGVDMLIFGNQLDYTPTKAIVETIFKQVKNGAIPYKRIVEANKRIAILHTKRSIIQKPIDFGAKRVELTKAYIKHHYHLEPKNITITPKMIVLHWTAEMGFEDSYKRLYPQTLYSDRKDIASASALNVSAHFLVDRNGTIYQLMPDNIMARHVIGLNYSTIGIENVGGEGNKKEDLTPAQLQANIALVRYLTNKYPTIKYLIGHYEYRTFENTPLWLEADAGYRTKKVDPGERFMQEVRQNVADLNLKSRYE